MTELEIAYKHCRTVTRRGAKNFYYAFITLPPQKRKAIYATYAFCRLCDDAADEVIPTEQKVHLLNVLRENLASAFAGSPDGPIFTALAHAAESFDIPQKYLQEVVSGVEKDLTKQRYENFEELRTYCYQVASVVGLICLHIFGCTDPKAKEYAIDLGLAMQLTNILRDIKEDLERDRIYLPQDEIREFGYTEEDLKAGTVNEPFRQLMRFQALRARQYFRNGFKLPPYLPARSRACPAVLGQIYSHVLDRIEAREFNVFNGRVSLSKPEKYLVTTQTWIRSFLPMTPART